MEHASTQAALDYMKKLAGVSHDSELAEKLGYSKQAVSSVRKRQCIPLKWFAKASLVFGVPVEELQTAGVEKKYANIDQMPRPVEKRESEEAQAVLNVERRVFEEEKRRLWEERRELMAENRQLHREKEELLRENGDLRATIARLEERKHRHDLTHGIAAEDSGVA